MSKKISLISLLLCAFSLVLVYFDVLGLIPMGIAVISLFTAIVHGGLWLSGRDSGPIEAYQDGKKTTARSLTSFFSSKK
ncbi:hypothetical protein [Vibrio comitans]|uniref:Uncharacterized protein n=1 Tax=Vibrio comitans NBRC 102076 TaxID=1219078 RepID=A0A4Y3IQV6_9VIBR|nr:hypothetical protein [Vibrio comitans]GEA61567.1 hypothetical protein VCO01S_27600 [Vibrio comitans NBRC 102076]